MTLDFVIITDTQLEYNTSNRKQYVCLRTAVCVLNFISMVLFIRKWTLCHFEFDFNTSLAVWNNDILV